MLKLLLSCILFFIVYWGVCFGFFFFSSRRRHTRWPRDWSSDVCSSDLRASAGTAEARLIVDPIDGTRNFVRGIPVFATLLAIETGGEVVAGVASAPALGARWHAARGGGAFRDGRRILVSRIESLEHAMLFHGNLGPGEAGPPPGIAGLIARVERTRGFGDFLQHMLVAEGAGEVAIDPVMQPWDIAAPQVIVEEAGGRATGLGGERSIYAGSLVTSNGPLHETALRALAHPT